MSEEIKSVETSSIISATVINPSLQNGGTGTKKENGRISPDSVDKKKEVKITTNGDVKSPLNIPNLKKEPSYLRTPTKSLSPKSPEGSAGSITGSGCEKKKIPMNKVQVGSTPSPNLKVVRSKIGSLENSSYKPGGGKVKIENKKLKWNAQPRIEAKNDTYTPGGGDKKIEHKKLQWNAKSKIGSLENATHKPGGGEKKIESVKLDFKEKAKPKIGSKDNIKHSPGGGTVKTSMEIDVIKNTSCDIEEQKLEIKAQSKIGSLENVKHKPGGGDKKIYDEKSYAKQTLKEKEDGDAKPTDSSQQQQDIKCEIAHEKRKQSDTKEDVEEIKQTTSETTTTKLDKIDERVEIKSKEEVKEIEQPIAVKSKHPDKMVTDVDIEESAKVKSDADIKPKLDKEKTMETVKENVDAVKETTDALKECDRTNKSDTLKESAEQQIGTVEKSSAEKNDAIKKKSVEEYGSKDKTDNGKCVKEEDDAVKNIINDKEDLVKKTDKEIIKEPVKQIAEQATTKTNLIESIKETPIDIKDNTNELAKAKIDIVGKEFLLKTKEDIDNVEKSISAKSDDVKQSTRDKSDIDLKGSIKDEISSSNRITIENQNEPKEITSVDSSGKLTGQKENVSQNDFNDAKLNPPKNIDVPINGEIPEKKVEQKINLDKQETNSDDTTLEQKKIEQNELIKNVENTEKPRLEEKMTITEEESKKESKQDSIDKNVSNDEKLQNLPLIEKPPERKDVNGGLNITKTNNNEDTDDDVVSLPGSVFPVVVTSQQSSGTRTVF